eukprot:1919778-Pyramimonas_sp.AAC.1
MSVCFCSPPESGLVLGRSAVASRATTGEKDPDQPPGAAAKSKHDLVYGEGAGRGPAPIGETVN